jgi:hypothetical protein
VKPRIKPKPETAGQWKMGRPTKYKVEMCDTAIEMGKQGKSLVQIAAALDIDKDTILNWIEAYPDFYVAINKAKALSEAHWTDIAQKHLIEQPQGDKLNTTLWFMNMRNRFGWHNGEQSYKHEHNHKGGIALAYGDPNTTDDKDETKE